jgi:YD repeat-containing protein
VTGIGHLQSAPDTYLQRFTYTYDKVANRTTCLELDGSRTTWTYDAAYRLTQENRSGTAAHHTIHTYDPAGNRLYKDVDGARTTFAYDPANQVEDRLDPAGTTFTFAYDNAGNLTVSVPRTAGFFFAAETACCWFSGGGDQRWRGTSGT